MLSRGVELGQNAFEGVELGQNFWILCAIPPWPDPNFFSENGMQKIF